MTDILILFAADKKPAAETIARACREAGYAVALDEIADPDSIADRIRDIPAALLVWSRPLVSQAMNGSRMASLRKLPNLIEISTDGIEPDTGEAGRVVLLSGWRGQPHHLGWQRVLDTLKRLRKPSAAAAPPPVAEAAAPRAATAAPAAGRSNGSGRRLALPAIALAVAIAATIGAVSWNKPQAPAAQPAARASPAPAAAIAPETASVAEAPRIQGPVVDPVGVDAVSTAAPPVEVRPARATAQALARKPVQTRPAKLRKASIQAPTKHYSRRNSKTMRQFCARSGRSTPQCRSFLRSMRGGA